jgi:predicted nucleic acid-binding protein
MRYLLDSTLLIDHANGDRAATSLLRQLVENGHQLFTCDVVTCETLSLGDDEQRRHIGVLLDALDYVATSPTAARWAADSRRQRHLAGGKRSLGDALIGGVAAQLEAVIVTRNRPDFERQGLVTLDY